MFDPVVDMPRLQSLVAEMAREKEYGSFTLTDGQIDLLLGAIEHLSRVPCVECRAVGRHEDGEPCEDCEGRGTVQVIELVSGKGER